MFHNCDYSLYDDKSYYSKWFDREEPYVLKAVPYPPMWLEVGFLFRSATWI